MTGDQWRLVPDRVLRNGTSLIGWLDARGIRRPSLLDLEEERVRRSQRTGATDPAGHDVEVPA